MYDYIIWIDQKKAKVYRFYKGKVLKKTFKAEHQEHHTHALDHIDQAHFEREFFSKLVKHISHSKKIMIIGPSLTKTHFQKYFQKAKEAEAVNIIGCETVADITDNQIFELGKAL